jgi:hypothetical protein
MVAGMRGRLPHSLFCGRSLCSAAALAALGAWLLAACASEESPYTAVASWDCYERKATTEAGASAGGAGGALSQGGNGGAADAAPEASCDCFGERAGLTVDDPREPVSTCSGWRCCYAWPTDDGSYDCRCEDEPADVQLAGYCEGAASDRGGEVVANCPPTPRDDASYCAFQGESCDPEFLEEQSLNGCCAGLSCEPDTYGYPVCR